MLADSGVPRGDLAGRAREVVDEALVIARAAGMARLADQLEAQRP